MTRGHTCTQSEYHCDSGKVWLFIDQIIGRSYWSDRRKVCFFYWPDRRKVWFPIGQIGEVSCFCRLDRGRSSFCELDREKNLSVIGQIGGSSGFL